MSRRLFLVLAFGASCRWQHHRRTKTRKERNIGKSGALVDRFPRAKKQTADAGRCGWRLRSFANNVLFFVSLLAPCRPVTGPSFEGHHAPFLRLSLTARARVRAQNPAGNSGLVCFLTAGSAVLFLLPKGDIRDAPSSLRAAPAAAGVRMAGAPRVAGGRSRPPPDLRHLALALCALCIVVGSAQADVTLVPLDGVFASDAAPIADALPQRDRVGDARGGSATAASAPTPTPTEYEAFFPPPVADGPEDPSEASFCVVIRTYWKHGLRRNQGLEMLLSSLRAQNVSSWEAIVVVMDGRPFYNLHQLVDQFHDPRIWVYSEWVGDQFSARDAQNPRQWAAGYHEALYSLTDDAVAACPRNSTWVVVTNGDNEVAEGFFWTIAERGKHADLVALDFFSRFQRPTARACDRFGSRVGQTERAADVGSIYEKAEEGGSRNQTRSAAAEREEDPPMVAERASESPSLQPAVIFPPAADPAPLCKRNLAAWCNTDLGANAFRKARMDAERVRFGEPHGGLPDSGGEHADGLLAADLIDAGWRLERVSDGCFFSHSPNPQACAWAGGVWDDRFQAWGSDGVGGSCIKLAEAKELVRKSLAEETNKSSGGGANAVGEEGSASGRDEPNISEDADAFADMPDQSEMGDGGSRPPTSADDDVDDAPEEGDEEEEEEEDDDAMWAAESDDAKPVDQSPPSVAESSPKAEDPLEPLEMVEIELSGWQEGARYLGVPSPPPRTILCLREIDSESERLWGDRMDVFGTDCADELDRPALLARSRRLGRPDPTWVHGGNAKSQPGLEFEQPKAEPENGSDDPRGNDDLSPTSFSPSRDEL